MGIHALQTRCENKDDCEWGNIRSLLKQSPNLCGDKPGVQCIQTAAEASAGSACSCHKRHGRNAGNDACV
jgi:hypothetical protein